MDIKTKLLTLALVMLSVASFAELRDLEMDFGWIKIEGRVVSDNLVIIIKDSKKEVYHKRKPTQEERNFLFDQHEVPNDAYVLFGGTYNYIFVKWGDSIHKDEEGKVDMSAEHGTVYMIEKKGFSKGSYNIRSANWDPKVAGDVWNGFDYLRRRNKEVIHSPTISGRVNRK